LAQAIFEPSVAQQAGGVNQVLSDRDGFGVKDRVGQLLVR